MLDGLGITVYAGDLVPRSREEASVTARSDMRVMVLGPREFDVIVGQEPAIARRLLEAMARRIRQNERSLQH